MSEFDKLKSSLQLQQYQSTSKKPFNFATYCKSKQNKNFGVKIQLASRIMCICIASQLCIHFLKELFSKRIILRNREALIAHKSCQALQTWTICVFHFFVPFRNIICYFTSLWPPPPKKIITKQVDPVLLCCPLSTLKKSKCQLTSRFVLFSLASLFVLIFRPLGLFLSKLVMHIAPTQKMSRNLFRR